MSYLEFTVLIYLIISYTIKSLYQQGAMHVGYYPDDPIEGHPDTTQMRQVFDLKSSRLVP